MSFNAWAEILINYAINTSVVFEIKSISQQDIEERSLFWHMIQLNVLTERVTGITRNTALYGRLISSFIILLTLLSNRSKNSFVLLYLMFRKSQRNSLRHFQVFVHAVIGAPNL